MSQSNVNLNGNASNEINVKRLGEQQKEILRLLYRTQQYHQQVEIIRELYGEVTNSRKVSVSRSISRLREHGLVYEENYAFYPALEAWLPHRPRYAITDEGEGFVESDARFPEIGGGGE